MPGIAPGGTIAGLVTRDLHIESRATIRGGKRRMADGGGSLHPPCGQPQAITEDVRGITHRALAATAGGPLEYLQRPGFPARLAACT